MGRQISFNKFEEMATQAIESFGVTRSDAQGFVEAHADRFAAHWVHGSTPREAAAAVFRPDTTAMTKAGYIAARRLIRDNGRYALRWLTWEHCLVMDRLLYGIQDSKDWLQERADIVAYCLREGIHCTARHTQPLN